MNLSRLVFPLLAAGFLALSGCNKADTSERPPEAGDVAVARINGQTIWTSDVRNEAVAQGQIGPGEPLDITSDLFSRTLEEVIDQRLLAKAARDRGIDKSIAAKRRLQAASERILGDMLVENTIDTHIDDKAVKEQYDDQVKLSKQSEEIRTRLILLKSKEDAEAVMKQLQAGALFEAMAMERSIDQATRFNGGDMGYYTTDIMPQAYKDVISTAKAGDTVGPVQGDGGWAILRIEDRRPEQVPTLEEERPVIMRYLIYNQVAGLLKNLRENAKVEMLLPKSAMKDGDQKEPANAPQGADAADAAAASASGASSSSSSGSASKKAVALSQPLGTSKPGATKLLTQTPGKAAGSPLLPGIQDPVAGQKKLFAPASAKGQ